MTAKAFMVDGHITTSPAVHLTVNAAPPTDVTMTVLGMPPYTVPGPFFDRDGAFRGSRGR